MEGEVDQLYPDPLDPDFFNSNTTPQNITSGIGPDGTETAMIMQAGATGFNQENVTIPADTKVYKFSVWVKALDVGARYNFSSSGINAVSQGSGGYYDFDLDSFVGANTLTSVESVVRNDGWVKLILTATNNGTGTIAIMRQAADSFMAGKVAYWGLNIKQEDYDSSTYLEQGVRPAVFLSTPI